MLAKHITFRRKAAMLAKYLRIRLRKSPIFINLEVTRHCNATCNFCDYWQTKSETRLDDYVDAIRAIDPLVVAFTGGEPLVRKDLPRLVAEARALDRNMYLTMVTNASLLDLDKARELRAAGLDQISISLDYLSEKHDRNRGLDGSFAHIDAVVRQIVSAELLPVVINCIIMDDNLDDVARMPAWAAERGARVAFTTYSTLKNGNEFHMPAPDRAGRIREVIEELIRLKGVYGNINNSSWYLRRAPGYFQNEGVGRCHAGTGFLQVTASGHLRPCAELPVYKHYTDAGPLTTTTDCTKCWYSCRGESQTPLSWERLMELLRPSTMYPLPIPIEPDAPTGTPPHPRRPEVEPELVEA